MTLRGRSLPGRRLRDVRAQLCARAGGERGRANRGEEGFILLESVVAISLIAVLLAALGGFTLNAVSATNELRARQAATHIATSAMAAVAALPATDLVTGRYSSNVDLEWTNAPDLVEPWLADMDRAYDPILGNPVTIPTTPQPVTLNDVDYKVTTYLGMCKVRSATSTDCVRPSLGTGIEHLRAVVAVTWTGRACSTGTRAADNPCAYVTSTLINKNPDPVFNTNRATPPVRPVVTNPGNQVSTVGATVSLQLEVDDNTGVPPLTWQLTGTLPLGLNLSASGLVSGSPTTPIANTPLTVTVMDAFGRTGSASFTWTVVAKPTITTPAAQTSNQGQAVNLAVASTCPHTPCRFTMAGAPAGLSINVNTGAITGTPTTIAVSPAVTVTITDVDNVSATTAPFSWTIIAGVTIGNPAPLNATVGNVKNRAITYTCPTATCALLLSNTVPGMGLTTNSALATNNTALTLTVNSGSGTVYIAGLIQASAVPTGTSRVWNPTVRITSGATNVTSAAGVWTIYARPTLSAVGTRNATVTTTKNIPITYTCPNAPCVFTLANTIPGLGLSATSGVTTTNNTLTLTVTGTSGTVYVNGRVGSTAVPTGQLTRDYATALTITDSDSAATSSTGTWTASREPNITNPGSQAVEPQQDISMQLTAACPNGGCTWEAEALFFGTWVPLSISSTGRITVTDDAPDGTYTVHVTVTDSDGVKDEITFSLTVQAFTLTIPNQTTVRPATGAPAKIVTVDVSALIRPLADGYTYSVSGGPTWLTMSADGILTASIVKASVQDTSIRVTVTSTISGTSTVFDDFSWTLSG